MEVKLSRDRLKYFRGRFDYGQKLKRKSVSLCAVFVKIATNCERSTNDNFVRLFLGCKRDSHI
jgi:hypothetical protein